VRSAVLKKICGLRKNQGLGIGVDFRKWIFGKFKFSI
jgi:hypothetical protein